MGNGRVLYDLPRDVGQSDLVQVYPVIHAIRIEPAYGDFYARCACGFLSLPFAERTLAERWTCPDEAASIEKEHNHQLFLQRVRDAVGSGYEHG